MPTLPLTVFEEYLFHENSADYPCNTWFRAEFKGRVNQDSMEEAARCAARRHPFLTARITRNRLGTLLWDIDPERAMPVEWSERDSPDSNPGFGFIDLESDPPFLIHIVQGPEHWEFFVRQHHAISDGSGSLNFFHDLICAYDAIEGGEKIELPRLNVERLPTRNQYGLTLKKRIALVPAQIVGLLISTSLFRRNVASLGQSTESDHRSQLPENAPRYATRTLPKERYLAFRKAAKNMGYSVNDLLLAYFHFAIGKYREAKNIGSPLDWIRISVPVGLRSKADKYLSACNAISIVSIDRQAKGLPNKKRLIRRAKEDMQLIKKGNLGLTFLLILWIRKHLPGGIKAFCKCDKPRTSTVFTNVGQQFAHSRLRASDGKLVCGGSRLETFTTIAPFRPYSHATLQTFVYAGELKMTLHYDPREMPSEDANALLDLFEQEILQTE